MRSHLVATDSIRAIRLRGDRIMAAAACALWLATAALAPIYNTWLTWAVCGTFLFTTILLLTWLIPGTRGSRVVIGLCLMGFPVLILHQTHGFAECHVAFYILLALLLYYRDWRPICWSAIVAGLTEALMVWLQVKGYPIFLLPDIDHAERIILIHLCLMTVQAFTLIFLTTMIRLEALESSAIAAFGERIIQSGSLNLTFDSERHRGAAARGLTSLLNAVLSVSRQSGTLATRITRIAEDISSSSAHMVRIAEDKIRDTAFIRESVQSMAEATEQIKLDCTSVAQVATQSANIVAEGCATIQQTATLMLAVAETASSTVAEITQLKTASQQIESIVEIMNDMASQSALLALNASIEAARAGEKGRGFQVVAQEIRSLSERSYQSLSEVQAIVDSIRRHVDQLQNHAERFQSAAGTGRSQVTAAYGALAEVSQHLPNVADRVGRVLRTTGHQAVLSAEVVAGMTLIDEAMHNIAGEVRGVSALSQSLEQISEDLSANVSRFLHEGQPLQPALA